MASWEAAFGGSSGGNYRLHVDANYLGHDIAGNYSTISYTAYVYKVAGSGFFNSSSGGSINVNGYAPGRSFGAYDFRSTGTYYLANNETYTIAHDSSGNANPFFGASYDLQNGPYVTTSSTGGNFALPTIPRNATITSFTQAVTDSTLVASWSSSDNVDYVSWWSVAYDGGGHHDTPASGTGPFTATLSNLRSESTYDITVAVRRADSGLWTTSSTVNVNTGKQANFFGIRVP